MTPFERERSRRRSAAAEVGGLVLVLVVTFAAGVFIGAVLF